MPDRHHANPAGKPLPGDCANFCILVAGEEIQCDHGFQCEDCGHDVPPETPTDRDHCTYGRFCPECGHRYGIRSWTEEA